jgi:membrane protease YdiL (CAAX protease family)
VETRKRIQEKIITFLLLTFAISSVSYYVMISRGSARDVVMLWMWTPGIAAIITQLVFRGKLRDFGWRLGELKYLLLGYGTPLIYASVIYLLVWATELGGFRPQSPIRLFMFATLGLVVACMSALGEEIGWRGLLVPELATITTFTKTALVTGIIWAIWHYPAIIFADYHTTAPRWFDLLIITMSVFGMSIFTAWLRLKSGSMWPTVLWHGGHNLFVQQIFLDMTVDTTITEYFVDDFGIGVLLASLVVGYIFWRKRSELPSTLHAV